MIVVIDCGNTYSNIAFFESEHNYHKDSIATKDIVSMEAFADIFSKLPYKSQVTNVIVSSVVPSKNSLLKAIFKQLSKRVIFIEEIIDQLDMKFNVDNISEVGSDRIANSFYAAEIIKSPAIIIDFGTATTFDFISEKREYLGGVIMPGIRLSIESLASKTEKLTQIDFKTPKELIGHNTNDAICAGILYSNLGAIEYIYRNSQNILNGEPKIIATGGFGKVVMQNDTAIEIYDPDVTLKGLYLISIKIQKNDL
jgi:type III pantothenate kinase